MSPNTEVHNGAEELGFPEECLDNLVGYRIL